MWHFRCLIYVRISRNYDERKYMNLIDKFRLKVYQSEGQQYEDLFVHIMSYKNHEFKPVKAHGNIGDRGNDGWINSLGEYYQVYAPSELFKNTSNAEDKIKSDFKKLKEYWDSISIIKHFYFVVNDKFNGVPPNIPKLLKQIKEENNIDNIGIFDSFDLERVLFELPHDKICSILGVSTQEYDPVYDDRKKVREFLDKLGFVTSELFSSGRTAGYFFPSKVFDFISEFASDDWQFNRLLSKNQEIAEHQINMRNQLVSMHNQIIIDHHYNYIGSSFKYNPPYELEGRNELIESKQNSMEEFIKSFAISYTGLRDYSA